MYSPQGCADDTRNSNCLFNFLKTKLLIKRVLKIYIFSYFFSVFGYILSSIYKYFKVQHLFSIESSNKTHFIKLLFGLEKFLFDEIIKYCTTDFLMEIVVTQT